MPASPPGPLDPFAPADDVPVLRCQSLTKSFDAGRGRVIRAVDGISLTVRPGGVTGILGPDGAGKTTLIRLAAGLLRPTSGSVAVLGIDLAHRPHEVQSRIGYMPQKFGLYEDLSVRQNLDLYADLHGLPPVQRRQRYDRLMTMTGLAPFMTRLSGRLSGGMKQKLGLACTLLSTPQVLLLDEPTVGVDPLSRRELWEIIGSLVDQQHITVLLSTAYMDEAERCRDLIVLNEGRVLGSGPPAEFSQHAQGRVFRIQPPEGMKARQLQTILLPQPGIIDATVEAATVRVVTESVPSDSMIQEIQRAGGGAVAQPAKPRCEDGFMILLHAARSPSTPAVTAAPAPAASPMPSASSTDAPVMVSVHDLIKDFGHFRAVDHVSFEVRRGEIFGLLGPNGAGKSTTFRMMCGLLPATSGTLSVAGVDLRRARAEARQRLGYVAQKFSQYGQLSVLENLRFFAGAYGLWGRRRTARVDWAMDQFDLRPTADRAAAELSAGYKNRLAMACALMHEPEIVFLDEPTSGIDPLARREFWQRISSLADHGVTVIVTTHAMAEAEYCDHMVILMSGRVLAHGSPAEIRAHAAAPVRPGEPAAEPSMEDAFVSIIESAATASQRPTEAA